MVEITNLSQQDFTFFILVLAFAVIILVIIRKLLRVSFPYFFMGIIGLVTGLTVGSLVSTPFSNLPGVYGRWLPIIVDVFIAVGVLDLFLAQSKEVAEFFKKVLGKIGHQDEKGESFIKQEIAVDTSVLIDGRIEEIARTGFVMAKLLVPKFVLDELQIVADSDDTLKRAKGRKGLEVLDRLQHDQSVKVEIVDELSNSREPVDSRLIKFAKIKKAKILTVDYNLNKIAKIQSVEVLNINELSESIKPVLIPGENVVVKVIQIGKENGQGIGYLTDGTMIVVEGGDKFVGREVECEVVRIFQTLAGKMIFVQPKRKITH